MNYLSAPSSSDVSCAAPDLSRFQAIRQHTESLTAALTAEDQGLQSMTEASPVKWHRAHTTWFFEQFLLLPFLPGYTAFDPAFCYLFNSYYDRVGDRQPQAQRGLIARPDTACVTTYRQYVDNAMARLLAMGRLDIAERVEIGLQHEQQHQELIVTDVLHAFAQNIAVPAILPSWVEPTGHGASPAFVTYAGGLMDIGMDVGVNRGFCYDNETPRHRTYLQPYRLASQLVCNGAWRAFMEDGGYRTPTLWMADGWAHVTAEGWKAPLYWREVDGAWHQAGPAGLTLLDLDAPVRHISWYEADAYARWAGARLPTEMEWETASADRRLSGMMGHVWQWTGSAYRPYPGFTPLPDALGEYNGKFMINQMVLRGSSAVTPPGHGRCTYRNFFHPQRRWQFSGVRLAQDV